MEEEVTSGVRTCSRDNDSLAQALGNPEHPGRVRGVGVYRSFKDVFRSEKPKTRGRPTNAQLRMELEKEYDLKLAQMEARLLSRMASHQFAHPSEQGLPISPGIRRSNETSGTGGDEFDRMKVIRTIHSFKAITIGS